MKLKIVKCPRCNGSKFDLMVAIEGPRTILCQNCDGNGYIQLMKQDDEEED